MEINELYEEALRIKNYDEFAAFTTEHEILPQDLHGYMLDRGYIKYVEISDVQTIQNEKT